MNAKLSVIITTTYTFETLKILMSHLQQQTIKNAMELIFVVPCTKNFAMVDSEAQGFQCIKVVETGFPYHYTKGKTAGVQAATASAIVFVEDHCFPEKNWAELLVEQYEKHNYQGVAPLCLNANPNTAVSWSSFLINYSIFHYDKINFMCANNSSYRLETLLQLGDQLQKMLEDETTMQWQLQQQGAKFVTCKNIRVHHVNESLFSSAAAVMFHVGRVFATARCHNWPFWKKLMYTLGSPLIPLVRWSRVAHFKLIPSFSLKLKTFIVLPILLLADAVGQMLGYSIGPGDSLDKKEEFEVCRDRFITQKDRELIYNMK